MNKFSPNLLFFPVPKQNGFFVSFRFFTPPSTARRLQDEDVAGVDVDGALAAEINQPTVVPSQQVEPAGSWLTPAKPVRPQDAAVGQDGQRQRLPEERLSDDAVPASIFSASAAAVGQGEAFEKYGIAALEDLGIGQTGVGHVDVNP
jgi:hypothetical protein